MSNWYVVTGGPSSGKTTLVNRLAELGYQTAVEDARHYLDLQRLEGHSVEEVRARHREFQLAVLKMQIANEARFGPEDLVFFDRAIPDSIAYYRFLSLKPDPLLKTALKHNHYRKAFVLDLLELHPDYARTEDEAEQHRLHALILQAYHEQGIEIVKVPVLPIDERVQYVLDRLE